MLNFDKEASQAFLEYCTTTTPKTTWIWCSIIVNIIYVVPAAIFGVHSILTSIALLPPLSLYIFRASRLLQMGDDKRRAEYKLLRGYSALLSSIGCLIASYKVISIIFILSYFSMIIVSILYLATVTLFLRNHYRFIRQGGYTNWKPRKPWHNTPAIIGVMLAAKVILQALSLRPNVTIALFSLLLLLVSLLIAKDSTDLLDYYFFRRLQN